jgi:hypothetical protein
MDEADWLAVRFEEQPTQLRPVAYRMPGLARRDGRSTSPLSAADRPTTQTKEAPSGARLAQSVRGTVSVWPCEPVRQPAPPTVLARLPSDPWSLGSGRLCQVFMRPG